MVDLANVTIGTLALAVAGLALYVILWSWWIRPLAYAVSARQWGWAAAIAVGGGLVGILYLHTQTATFEAWSARGDVIVRHGRMWRVLKARGGQVLALDLGEYRSTVAL